MGAIKKNARIWIISLPLNNSCLNEVSLNQGLKWLGKRISLIVMFLMDETTVRSIISITNNQLHSSCPKLELGDAKIIIKNGVPLITQSSHKKFLF